MSLRPGCIHIDPAMLIHRHHVNDDAGIAGQHLERATPACTIDQNVIARFESGRLDQRGKRPVSAFNEGDFSHVGSDQLGCGGIACRQKVGRFGRRRNCADSSFAPQVPYGSLDDFRKHQAGCGIREVQCRLRLQ